MHTTIQTSEGLLKALEYLIQLCPRTEVMAFLCSLKKKNPRTETGRCSVGQITHQGWRIPKPVHWDHQSIHHEISSHILHPSPKKYKYSFPFPPLPANTLVIINPQHLSPSCCNLFCSVYFCIIAKGWGRLWEGA